MTITIALIIFILLLCVVLITFIHKREQERSRIRQIIAKHKYRANIAADILSNFSQLPIGINARKMLMQYIQGNYLAALKLMPSDEQIQRNLDTIQLALNNPPPVIDQQRLVIPSEFDHVKLLIGKLNTLAKFLLKIKAAKGVDPMLVNPAVSQIMGLISEAKICAYMMQGKEFSQRKEYTTARHIFLMAKTMLSKIHNKGDRLEQLENELNLALQEIQQTDNNNKKQPELDNTNENQPDQEENESTPVNDDIFGPRKKW